MGQESSTRLSTGISGLDEILYDGLIPGRAYLVRGGPGTGKTTLGLHFLTTGVANGEKVLFIGLGEPEDQLRKNAAASGFDLQGIAFLDLSPSPEFFTKAQAYDIFSPAEVEREPTTQKIVEHIEKLKPARVFIDAMTQFRYLSTDNFQFRKQVLSFLGFLVSQRATVLFTSQSSVALLDDDLQFLSDGIIHLELAPRGRTIHVTKFRGSPYRDGFHAMRLSEKGMEVFPRLAPQADRREFVAEAIPFGVPELDELLQGGLERSTVTMISGPSGAGKTTLGLQFMKEAAGRGERSVVYVFEEDIETLVHRSEAVSIPIHAMMKRGTLSVVKVDSLEFSPNEFAHLVRREVEEQNTRTIMVDSIASYRLSMQGEDLVNHLHTLCAYLKSMGITVLLINEVEAVTGEFRATEMGISFLADNIVFLRYLEMAGEIRKAIGVLKKRVSNFEKTLRELQITRYGIKVGKPLTQLRGILSGTPERVEPIQRDDKP